MHFRRIKYTGMSVELQWDKARADGRESRTTTFSSSDKPLPEFIDGLAAFGAQAAELIEVSETWGEKLRVQSLTLNEEQDGRRGLVITCLRELKAANAPLVINTPHLREDVDGAGGAGFMLPEMMGLIEEIEAAAERYLNGERDQSDLFAGDKPKAHKSGIEKITLEYEGKSVSGTPEMFEDALDELNRRKRRRA